MCDNLGISDEKITVYALTYLGQTVVLESIEELMDWISTELEQSDAYEEQEFILTKRLMLESEIEALPDFEGY